MAAKKEIPWRQIPKTEDQAYHVRFCPNDRMAVSREAEKRGLPASSWIRMIVLDWLEKENGK